MQDFFKDLLSFQKERMKTPFWGALFISSLIVHWEIYYYLIASDNTPENKIIWIKSSVSNFDFFIQIIVFVIILFLPLYANEKYQKWLDSLVHERKIKNLDYLNLEESKSKVNEQTRVDKIYIEKERERSFSTDYDTVKNCMQSYQDSNHEMTFELERLKSVVEHSNSKIVELETIKQQLLENNSELKSELSEIGSEIQEDKLFNDMVEQYLSLISNGELEDVVYLSLLTKRVSQGDKAKDISVSRLLGATLMGYATINGDLKKEAFLQEFNRFLLRTEIYKNKKLMSEFQHVFSADFKSTNIELKDRDLYVPNPLEMVFRVKKTSE